MKKSTAGIALFCLLIGFGLVAQSGVADGQSLYVSPKPIMEYRTSIESEQREIEQIQNLIREAEDQLEQYELAHVTDDFGLVSEMLAEEVLLHKMFSGYEAVRGPGVLVVIDDGTRPLLAWESVNDLLVHEEDIIRVINDLRRYGAEAIAVNGQRIADTTSISCSGYTVRINGQVSARPFVIQAIGDGKRLSESLLNVEGYGAFLRNFGVQFSVEMLEEIEIPAYPGDAVYQFMSNVNEEEAKLLPRAQTVVKEDRDILASDKEV